MPDYNEADVKLRLLILLTHMYDQDMMDDLQFSYWRNLVREADADANVKDLD